MRGVKYWNWLLREVLGAPSLEVTKVSLDGFEQDGLVEDAPVHSSGIRQDDL